MKQDVAFVVKHLDIDFVAPAKFNELIDVSCELKKAGAASIIFSQTVSDSSGRVLVEAEVKIACVSLSAMKPIAIPDSIKEVMIRGS